MHLRNYKLQFYDKCYFKQHRKSFFSLWLVDRVTRSLQDFCIPSCQVHFYKNRPLRFSSRSSTQNEVLYDTTYCLLLLSMTGSRLLNHNHDSRVFLFTNKVTWRGSWPFSGSARNPVWWKFRSLTNIITRYRLLNYANFNGQTVHILCHS